MNLLLQKHNLHDFALWMLRVFLLLLLTSAPTSAQQQQDPRTLNGGSVLAMAGKGCVALAVDKRFGSGPQMVNIAPRHVLTPHPQVMVAFTGLEGDVQSLSQDLLTEVTAKLGRALGFSVSSKTSSISPRAMASLASHILYNRRQSPYYVEPLVVGLSTMADGKHRPFLCALDCIGAKSSSEAFVCGGAACNSLYGTAEALWEADLEPEELAHVCGKAFQSALERDCLSGYGSVVYLITKDGIVEYDLASRND